MATRVVTVTPTEVAAARALIEIRGGMDKVKVDDKVDRALVRIAEAETPTG
jgi:hypothetical protein